MLWEAVQASADDCISDFSSSLEAFSAQLASGIEAIPARLDIALQNGVHEYQKFLIVIGECLERGSFDSAVE